jgi:hypothetical protein
MHASLHFGQGNWNTDTLSHKMSDAGRLRATFNRPSITKCQIHDIVGSILVCLSDSEFAVTCFSFANGVVNLERTHATLSLSLSVSLRAP